MNDYERRWWGIHKKRHRTTKVDNYGSGGYVGLLQCNSNVSMG